MISGIIDAIPRRRFARWAYVPMKCGLIGMHATGWRRIDAARTVFHPRETLPSAARPCCGRRSCPVSRCPVFGYGTNCSLTVRKPIRGWVPSPSLPFSFVRDCSLCAWSLRFLDRIPEGTLITPRTDVPSVLSEI